MEDRPFFSICIPAFEQTLFLRQTLDSIKRQVFTDYEIILSDDSRSNAVYDLVRSYDFGSKLRYFKQIPSLGSPENWNFAMKQARGVWVKMLHHDDSLFDADTLLQLQRRAQASKAAWIAGAPVHPPPPPRRICSLLLPRGLRMLRRFPGIFAFGNCLGVPSVILVRRDVDQFYDRNLIWQVDVHYYLKMVRDFGFFEFHPHPVIWRNAGEHNLTLAFNMEPQTEVGEYFYMKQDFPGYFPFWLDFLIAAKLVRICYLAGVHNKTALPMPGWEAAPFWLRFYFFLSGQRLLQLGVVWSSKAIFRLAQKFFGKYLMKRIPQESPALH